VVLVAQVFLVGQADLALQAVLVHLVVPEVPEVQEDMVSAVGKEDMACLVGKKDMVLVVDMV